MAGRFNLPNVPRLVGGDISDAHARELIYEWMKSTREVMEEALTTLSSEAQRRHQPAQLPAATVAQLEGANPLYRAGGAPRIVLCTNDVGGATIAYSDGTNWRRSTDLAIVSET